MKDPPAKSKWDLVSTAMMGYSHPNCPLAAIAGQEDLIIFNSDSLELTLLDQII